MTTKTREWSKWTPPAIQAEALKYSTRAEFKKGSHTAYQRALKIGLKDSVCAHMQDVLMTWTYELLQEEALKYSTRGAFKNGSPRAYDAAKNWGVKDSICSHMKAVQMTWTYELLQEEALKYSTRVSFQKGSVNAYMAAQTRGVLDSICGHMVRGFFSNGFEYTKPAILYYIRFDHADEPSVWKIGITGRSAKERLKGILPQPGWIATVLQSVYFDSGYECYEMEQSLHAEYEKYSYRGPDILKSGNTELFTCNVLGV